MRQNLMMGGYNGELMMGGYNGERRADTLCGKMITTPLTQSERTAVARSLLS